MGHSYCRVACNGRLLMVDGGSSFIVREPAAVAALAATAAEQTRHM